jgi:trans-2,3-dihydro-3-hydroxyanthranilate isomerase
MGLPFYIVDVFTTTKYAGNQLAVVADAWELSDASMQEIAREMHFSETAFIRSEGTKDHSFGVRIFTPEHEVPFAGHPVLGTAYILQAKKIRKPVKEIALNLAAGRIPVSLTYENGSPATLWMRQNSPVFTRVFPPEDIARVLSLPEDTIDSRFPAEEVSTGLPVIIVPLKTRKALSEAKIDREEYDRLVSSTGAKALFIFCPEPHQPDNTFSARMFADYYGVPEDPATGSANGCLAGYLVSHRYFGTDAIDIRVDQGYEINRPSLIFSRAALHGDAIEVFVGGNVVMVGEGTLV